MEMEEWEDSHPKKPTNYMAHSTILPIVYAALLTVLKPRLVLLPFEQKPPLGLWRTHTRL